MPPDGPTKRFHSPDADSGRVPSTHWERRRLRADAQNGLESDQEEWGPWNASHLLPGAQPPVSLHEAAASVGQLLKGGGKGKWKKKDRRDRSRRDRDPDYTDSRAMAGILRHGAGRKGALALPAMGSHGEILLETLAGLLRLDASRVRHLVGSSIHPSGDHRYELVSFAGQDFVRATSKHSLELLA